MCRFWWEAKSYFLLQKPREEATCSLPLPLADGALTGVRGLAKRKFLQENWKCLSKQSKDQETVWSSVSMVTPSRCRLIRPLLQHVPASLGFCPYSCPACLDFQSIFKTIHYPSKTLFFLLKFARVSCYGHRTWKLLFGNQFVVCIVKSIIQ